MDTQNISVDEINMRSISPVIDNEFIATNDVDEGTVKLISITPFKF